MNSRTFAFFERAAILFIAASLGLSTAFGYQNPNLPNFQKVDEHVYRGAQPTDEGFRELAKLGIKTIVDLRLIGEHSQAQEERLVSSLGMRYVSVCRRRGVIQRSNYWSGLRPLPPWSGPNRHGGRSLSDRPSLG